MKTPKWMEDYRGNIYLPLCLILVFFFSIGWVSGWFLGESRVPIVGTFIPVVVALLGGISVALFERKAMSEKILKAVQEITADGTLPLGTSTRLEAKLGETSYWMLCFWCASIMVFCVGSFWGFQKGVAYRVPKYASLNVLTKDAKTNHFEANILQELLWHLQSNHVPEEEVEAYFREVVNPILKQPEKDAKGNWVRSCDLIWCVDRVLKYKRDDSAVPCSMRVLLDEPPRVEAKETPKL
jgi:hypothetical protein